MMSNKLSCLSSESPCFGGESITVAVVLLCSHSNLTEAAGSSLKHISRAERALYSTSIRHFSVFNGQLYLKEAGVIYQRAAGLRTTT